MTKMSVTKVLLCVVVGFGLVAWGAGQGTAGTPPSQGQKLAHADEHKDMKLVGTDDLQHRSTYQPVMKAARHLGVWTAAISNILRKTGIQVDGGTNALYFSVNPSTMRFTALACNP